MEISSEGGRGGTGEGSSSSSGSQDLDSHGEQQDPPEMRKRPVPEAISGYLLRLKNKPSTFSSWDSRFLSVDPASENLYFYSSEKHEKESREKGQEPPLQTLPLSNITKVQAVDQHSLQIIVKGKPETVIFLRAHSPEEKLRWVVHLEFFLKEVKAYESWLQLSQMTAVPSIQPHQGYLRKLKRTAGSSLSSWNNRFFRIDPVALTLDYFSRAPKEGKEDSKDKRTIMLNKIVDVRSIDPWTFQIEVKEDGRDQQSGGADKGKLNPKHLEKQNSSLQSGNMSYYCLQAKTQDEQAEWKSILENFLMDLMMYRDCKFLGDGGHS